MFSSLLRGKSKFSFCLECGVGDFKDDGNVDLVRQNTTTGQCAIWYVKNGAVTGTTNLPTMPLDWSIVDH